CFGRRQQPSLDPKSFIRPLDAFGSAPIHGQRSVVARELSPFTNRASPNFRRRIKTTANHGRDLSVLRECEIGEIAESMKAFRTLPDGPHRVVCNAQLRDRAAAANVFGEKNAIWRD